MLEAGYILWPGFAERKIQNGKETKGEKDARKR